MGRYTVFRKWLGVSVAPYSGIYIRFGLLHSFHITFEIRGPNPRYLD